NLSDFFHERVAVVTNPAIDRVREGDHFSVRVFLGHRPSLAEGGSIGRQIELKSPILMGGGGNENHDYLAAHRTVAREFGTCLIDDIACEFSESVEGLEAGGKPFSAEGRLKQVRAAHARPFGGGLAGPGPRALGITADACPTRTASH